MPRMLGLGVSLPETAPRAAGGSDNALGANDVLMVGINDTAVGGDILAEVTLLDDGITDVLVAGTDSRLVISGAFIDAAPLATFTAGENVQLNIEFKRNGITVDSMSIVLPVVTVADPPYDQRVYLPTDLPDVHPRFEVVTLTTSPTSNLITTSNDADKRFVYDLATS